MLHTTEACIGSSHMLKLALSITVWCISVIMCLTLMALIAISQGLEDMPSNFFKYLFGV